VLKILIFFHRRGIPLERLWMSLLGASGSDETDDYPTWAVPQAARSHRTFDLALNRHGSTLAVATANGVIQLGDLRELRRPLRQMDVEW